LKVTRRYKGLNLGRNKYLGSLIKRLYKNVLNTAIRAPNSGLTDMLLLREDFIKSYSNKKSVFSYESLYNRYLNKINLEDFSSLVIQLVNNSSKLSHRGATLRAIRVYLFGPYFGKWCPLVEFAHHAKMNGEKSIFYVGCKSDSEFQILSEIVCGSEGSAQSISTISDKLLYILSKLKLWINQDKPYAYGGFNSNQNFDKISVSLYQKNIVIPIQEDRRFSRISRLCEEFKNNNIGVLLFAYDLKAEELLELSKYPELMKRVIFASDLLDEHEVSNIQINVNDELKNLCLNLKYSKALNDLCYRDVPLHKHALEDLEQIILFRGVQLEVCIAAIEKLLRLQKIDAFIGFDNGINTCAWMRVCEQQSIPSFIHFYNSVLTPAIYQLLIDSFEPTAWLLGGSRQFDKLKGIKDAKNYFITGDILLDLIASTDRQLSDMTIKCKLGISFESKVIVLLSSYVTDDYTEERKRSIFTLVDSAARELGVSLIVKAHPNEDIQVLHHQMEEWKISRPILHSESLLDILFDSDLVCMYTSEAAQQAMSVGVPVLSMVPAEISADLDKHWGYLSSGAVAYVPLGEDPTEVIADLLFNHQSRLELINKGYAHIEASAGKGDGNNAKRIVDVVRSYC